MKRSKSSQRWLQAHHSDPFVKLSKAEGYRSRAVYKLKEVDEKYHLLRSGMTILELGAAPGGWTQYVGEKLGGKGRVIALDCLPMDALAHVEFIQGDFTEEAVQTQLHELLNESKVDVVLSDMAPNSTGIKAIDSVRSSYLAEMTLEAAIEWLKPDGILFMKLFHGPGFDEFVKSVRACFKQVSIRKPQASRSQSRETYLLARGYKI